MLAERVVEPELLDELTVRDQRALRSRRDIRRLNTWMGHPRIMARALQDAFNSRSPLEIVELGAGDGHFLWRVERRLQKRWPAAEATLVDRLDAFDPQLRNRFSPLGWHIQAEVADAIEWLRRAPPKSNGVILCNLFLHQLRAEQLAELFCLASRSACVVIALEPRREWWTYVCSRLLWMNGCGPITRHDGPVSIRAGFTSRELSALWPDDGHWQLVERPDGLFTHFFLARRKD
jgi:hypothetical protein